MNEIVIKDKNKILNSLLVAGFFHDVGKILKKTFFKNEGISPLNRFKSELVKDPKLYDVYCLNKYDHSLLSLAIFSKTINEPYDQKNLHIYEKYLFVKTEKEKSFEQVLNIDIDFIKFAIAFHHGKNFQAITSFFEKFYNSLKKENDRIYTFQNEIFSKEKIDKYFYITQKFLSELDIEHARLSRHLNDENKYKDFTKNIVNILKLISTSDKSKTWVDRQKLNKKDIYFKISTFHTDKIEEIIKGKNQTNLEQIYLDLFDRLKNVNTFIINQKNNKLLEKKDYEKNIFNFYISSLRAIFYRYLFFLPSDVQEEYPFSSLFEHMEAVASLSFSKYLTYLNSQDKDENNKRNIRLLLVDFQGIQKFIFDLGTQKEVLKRLKGKSFYVSLLLEDIKTFIFNFLDIPIVNLLIDGGGKFIIALPDIDKTKKDDLDLKTLKKILEEKIFEKFETDINVNLALSEPLELKDITSKIKDLLTEKIKQAKNQPFSNLALNKDNHDTDINIWNQKIFKTYYTQDLKLKTCKTCLKVYKSFDKNTQTCPTCIDLKKIASFLKDTKYLFFIKKEALDQNIDKSLPIIDVLNYKVAFIKNNKDIQKIKELNLQIQKIVLLNNLELIYKDKTNKKNKLKFTEFSNILHQFPIIDFSFIANYTPDKDLENIAKNEYLALLKGDIDNLGLLFKTGINKVYEDLGLGIKNKNYKLSLIKTLSESIKFFFEIYINEKVKKQYPNIYIVYSGGDDFVLFGKWDELIEFTKEMYQDFKIYVSENPSVHFSTSINLFHKTTPFKYIFQKAEENLDKAKDNKNKDSINIFDVTVKNRTFLNLFTDSKVYLLEQYKSNNISSSTIYKLYNLYKYVIDFVNDLNIDAYSQPQDIQTSSKLLDFYIKNNINVSTFLYHIKRNYNDEHLFNYLEKMSNILINNSTTDLIQNLEEMKKNFIYLAYIIYKLRFLRNKK